MRGLFRRTSLGGKKPDKYVTNDPALTDNKDPVNLEDTKFEFLPGITPRSPDDYNAAPVPRNSVTEVELNAVAPPRPLENPPLAFLQSNRSRAQRKRTGAHFSDLSRVPTLAIAESAGGRDSPLDDDDDGSGYNNTSIHNSSFGGAGPTPGSTTSMSGVSLMSKEREGETIVDLTASTASGTEGGGSTRPPSATSSSSSSSRRESSILGRLSRRERDSSRTRDASRRGRDESVGRGRERDTSVSRRPGLITRIFSAKGRRKDDRVVKLENSEAGDNNTTDNSARSNEITSARSNDKSARSTKTDEEDAETYLQYAIYLLSTDSSNQVSREYVEAELKRVPEISWLVKCALQAPLPACWTLYTPKGTDKTPYYANSFTHESAWTHPSDSTFKSLIGILQRGYDIRGQLKSIYTSVLQSAEQLSTQWQGPYYENEKSYYHHIHSNRSVWQDPFANSHYLAEICVKLLGIFASRADILEAAGGFAKRKEALRQARSRLEAEVGALGSQDLAYLYQNSLPGAVMDSVPGSVPPGGGTVPPHGSIGPPGAGHHPAVGSQHSAQGGMYNPHQSQQLAPHHAPGGVPPGMYNPAAQQHPNMMYNPGVAAGYPGAPGGPGALPAYAYGAAPMGGPHQMPGVHPGAAAYSHPGAHPGMYNQGTLPPYSFNAGVPGVPGHPAMAPYGGGIPGGYALPGQPGSPHKQPHHSAAHHSGYHPGIDQHHPGGVVGGGVGGMAPAASSGVPGSERGSEWFNNDRNLVRCNSRGKQRRERSRSKSKEPELRKLVRINSRDSLPKDMRLPSPFSHGYTGPVGAQASGGGAEGAEAEHYVRTNASIGRHASPAPRAAPSSSMEDLMRQSRDYADMKIGNKSASKVSEGSEIAMVYSDDSEGGSVPPRPIQFPKPEILY
ncbi:unnamed protein product [Amoebophrya sp. A25]|nr:unnamed protein product [Amoebophrya sp. A25]|eukprot:GSA25T00013623001.1